MSIFSQISGSKPQTNTFDLSHDRKFSMFMGTLTPMLVMETVPGDSINLSTSQIVRMAPMIAPVMHQINVYTHFFFVPNRILWDNWENFITGGEDGEDTSVFPFIRVRTDDTLPNSLLDYMGIPTNVDGVMDISALPFAAYQTIYNEYYRDQNLIDKAPIDIVDGQNDFGDQQLLRTRTRAWQHDYFTSALPWTQKGPEATIPLGTTAPLIFDATIPTRFNNTSGTPVQEALNTVRGTGNPVPFIDGNLQISQPSGTENIAVNVTTNTTVDLSDATAATIVDLRRAFKLQEWLEKNARGGSRYTESIMSHFGIRSQDSRLQRPEFLGGASAPISISEVLQTSDASAQETPQGNMAGHGISAGGSNRISYRCQEHGYIIGIVSVLPKTGYFQGIPKHYLKFDKFDYFWPSFQHIGEQAIQNKELYVDDDGLNDDTFGYTPRYAEYKYIPSTVHGAFRTSLKFWHMAREFTNRPQLNAFFINAAPTKRIFAVTDESVEDLYVHMHHRLSARRPMAYFGQPKM